MTSIRYTLLPDGPADRALIPILDWLLGQHTRLLFVGEFGDLRQLPHPPRSLIDRIRTCCHLYACELLFVHRDAEREPWETRASEIEAALAQIEAPPPAVMVIPVRMQEAWLLTSVDAIRKAADNPNGRVPLRLPALHRIESLPDPKKTLYDLLVTASELQGRRKKSFYPQAHAPRVTQYMEDFASLRELAAFQNLEQALRTVLRKHGWANQGPNR